MQTAPGSGSACRVMVGNGCGSGSVCGRHPMGGYIVLTNAHVVGTQIGRTVTVQHPLTGPLQGTVIAAGYSNRTVTDWAFVRIITEVELPITKLYTKSTQLGEAFTTGSPRCVWPLKTVKVDIFSVKPETPLVLWRPPTISGQSGSSVVQGQAATVLLTWLWDGNGAGQQTASIYKTIRSGEMAGALRPDGLREVPLSPVTDGASWPTSLPDWDIWTDSLDGDEFEPPTEKCPCPEITEQERKALDAIKAFCDTNGIDYSALLSVLAGERTAEQSGIDWVSLLILVLEILSQLIGD